ncbi:RrF2 family transcriptional regulator [Anaerocolumna chitinilytica]|uniref:Rrf2 family transcriptional regulator n=1 Tax=Anaerocolumna chitinilytica TaxID=1727145 RepID=A0A7I8DPX8_9FIRM|nr:Rrf2 family transcriptional regulator [Anaerocolumna chitinilytica]BCK00474.1 Rrf2 family transcriptional regulator [Anaerocolumna chitinilytica]
MQFSIGVEYALHCLLYMIDVPPGKSVGIKDLATYQGVSETYLSKVYTKLRKAGIVKAIPGVNGGYALALAPENISFWNVIEAVEGSSPMFQCAEIRQNELLLDKNNLPDSHTKCPCLIKVVMLEAEEQMRQYLKNKTLEWLHAQVKDKLPKEQREATIEWFTHTKSKLT